MSKKNSELVDNKQFNNLLDWFESHYTPGEKGANGKPRSAMLTMKGIKGNIVVQMIYDSDLKEVYPFIKND